MADQIRPGLFQDAERALRAGNLPRAEKWCRLQLETHPDDHECRVLLALVFAKSNRYTEAVELLERVTQEAPSFEAYVTLSTIFFFQGKIERALAEGESAIRLDPSELGTYNKIGHELVRLGRFTEAVAYFKRAVENGPSDLDSNQNLAAGLKDAGFRQESLEAWRRVTLLAPNLSKAWLNYGMLHLASHEFELALQAGTKAIECDLKSIDAFLLVALAYQEMGLAQDAVPILKRALAVDPNHPMVQASLGLALQEQGQFEEARRWLESSLKRWETNGLAYYTLVRSRTVIEDDRPLLDRIQSVIRDKTLGLLERSFMEYSLGKAFEDLKEYEASIAHFDLANKTAHEFWFSEKPWDPDLYRFNFQRTIDTFSEDLLASLRKHGLQSETPVLIVGMIRSGTTLVEQILSSHPDILGAGELTYWHEQAGRCFDATKRRVDREKLYEIANGYLETLNRSGSTAKRITDKLPHNYALLGLIHPALPNARIIHIRRNPLDNALSVFTTGYQRPPGFTLKRENIVFAYKEYLRIAAHWRNTLPQDRLLEIDYEDLIVNREAVTRRMIEFVGLDWNDHCLQHEKNVRTVHTPSAWQVRQPVYNTSVERWRRFEPWLGAFEELRGFE